MRENIGLFRGKRIDNGKWAVGNLLTPNDVHEGWYISFVDYLNEHGDFGAIACEVIPDTVGECTGLKDKNGKLIFEGDILLFGTRKLVVWWNDEAFQWQAKEEQMYPLSTFDGKIGEWWDNIDLGWIAAEVPCIGKMTTEIIGNIHDNPELLKGGADNG